MKTISFLLSLIIALLLISCNSENNYSRKFSIDELRQKANYVGREACRDCHEKEFNNHIGSHHDLAMDVANDSTVLGNFNNVTFKHLGTKSYFYKTDDKFFVRTEGIKGKIQDFEIKYVFGVYPLQQYLIDFGDGRFQTLPLSWDSRKKSEGGQRWFHIYDKEKIKHNDILYWTGSFQNWNYMCAECHSTNLIKGYDLVNKKYNTSWEEIDVSCEACHGPGSEHVRWGKADKNGVHLNVGGDLGVINSLKNHTGSSWMFKNVDDSIATLINPRNNNKLVETCARCHARRGLISEDYKHGGEFLDTHFPILLNSAQYYADGQIKDEDYVYGSFTQSKMFQAGVVCTDCHDSHSYKVHFKDNRLCAQCHKPEIFDTPKHHFHKMDGTGASCIKCHMPTTNYMVVDPRLDHSMRIPRPDLSIKIGSPNACNQCHTDKTNEWSLKATNEWYGDLSKGKKHFGEIFFEANKGNPKVQLELIKLANDKSQPEIIRATAIEYFQSFPNEFTHQALKPLLKNNSALLKYISTSSLMNISANVEYNDVKYLLRDSVRLVRIEAANAIAGIDTNTIPQNERIYYFTALEEYKKSLFVNAGNYSSHLSLGILQTKLGNLIDAEKEYKLAIEMEPLSHRAYVNLADLYRSMNRESDAEMILQKSLRDNNTNADVNYSLGLLKIREKKYIEAIKYLKLSATAEEKSARYIYVYAVALNSVGKTELAISTLLQGVKDFPYNQDILNTIVNFSIAKQDINKAKLYIERLVEYYPENSEYKNMLRRINQIAIH